MHIVLTQKKVVPLVIIATGHGSRQMCRVDRSGFPRTSAKQSRQVYGFQTGDIVKAVVTSGKKVGTYVGAWLYVRLAVLISQQSKEPYKELGIVFAKQSIGAMGIGIGVGNPPLCPNKEPPRGHGASFLPIPRMAGVSRGGGFDESVKDY